ncbi:MAG TPA: hypothetical protein DCF49_09000 [Lachnospiraceae bacterium]|nr:hypothetical protein [Lachnospiraceae bacterium]
MKTCKNTDAKPHIVLCAPRQTGKTTLVEKILREAGCPSFGAPVPVYGFQTRRLVRSDGTAEIYMFPAGSAPDSAPEGSVPPDARYLGSTFGRVKDVCPEAFDSYGTSLIRSARPGGLLIMDEIGHMEKNSPQFLEAVFEALDGDIPVLACVRYTEADAVSAGQIAGQAGQAAVAATIGRNPRSLDYLERIKHHPRVRLFMMTGENRDDIYANVRSAIFCK